MSNCIVCGTEIIRNERGECSYCAAEKAAAKELMKQLNQPPILTPETYFSPEAEAFYMGSTQFKRFMECESQALAILRGQYVPEVSTALLVGSYVDAHFSGTLDIFKAQHPDIFKRDGSLKAEYEQANYIIARIEQDEAFMAALCGYSQVIMTGEIEGVPVKIKVDSMLPDRTVDLKIMRDFADVYDKEEGWQPWWKALRYDIQGAIYQEIRRQNDPSGRRLPFGTAGATKEKPEPDIGLFDFPQDVLSLALEEVRANIVHFDSLKKGLYEPTGCGKCPWCRSQKKLEGWVAV